ncbi:MAG TPA: hypothetical protein VGF75_00350 [Candidatus Saccharimonadales bacterium]|jgi:hypothetical protein
MADLIALERQIKRSQTLSALASYFSSPVAQADNTLVFTTPDPAPSEEKAKVA